MQRDAINEQESKKLVWMKSDEFWSLKLDGNYNFSGHTILNSKTRTQKLVPFVYRNFKKKRCGTQFKTFSENPIFPPTQCCTEIVTSALSISFWKGAKVWCQM